MIPIAKPLIGQEEKEKVMAVLDSGAIAQGAVVKEFEEKFAEFIGTPGAISTSSGTTAVCLALQAAGVNWGDKVITTPFTFIATSNSILYCGAEPVFADVDERTFNISPSSIEEVIKNVTGVKAILAVHLYGLAADMDAIEEICKKYNLTLIEDCAQSHGAKYKGKMTGTFGKSAAYSFYPTKNMTTGEGGMVTSMDPDVLENARMLREHGASREYMHETLGYNYRMTNIEAAIGISQLEKLNKFNAIRKENARYFLQELAGLPFLTLPFVPMDCEHVYHQFTVKLPDENTRDKFIGYLKENQVGTKVYYPMGIHQQPFYKKLGFGNMCFPVTEKLTKQVVSLPIHPAVTSKDREYIVEIIKGFKP